MKDTREDSVDPREIVLDEAEGVLSSAQRDEDPEDLETVEILCSWQEMRRFAAPSDVRWRTVRDSLGKLAAQRPHGSRALSEWVLPRQWLDDHERLRERLESCAESVLDRDLRFDEEALRLFRLVDRWRLALHGARRAGIGDALVEELWEEVDERIVPVIARDASVYCGVAPYASTVLDLVAPDLEEHDPLLFSTLDIHVAVDRAGSFEVVGEPLGEPASDWQRIAEHLPREGHDLAAEAPSSGYAISFEWREPASSRFATMDLTADSGRERVARLAFWDDREPTGAFHGAEVGLFGVRASVQGHEAVFDLEVLRNAMARHRGRAPLRIRRPDGSESIWPMTAPRDERDV